MASLISFQAWRCYLSWGYLCVYNWYHDLTFDDTWIKVMWAQQKRERPWSRCWEPLDLSCRSMKKIFNNFAPIESPFGSFSYKSLHRMPFANFAGGQIYNVSFFLQIHQTKRKRIQGCSLLRLAASSLSTSPLLPLSSLALPTSSSSPRALWVEAQLRKISTVRRRRLEWIPLSDFGGLLFSRFENID